MSLIKKSLLTKQEEAQIVSAIEQAETNTSGEIRVRVERECAEDVLDRAAWWFSKLGMNKTVLRNGVLIYVAVDSRKSAIIGDSGIHAKVGSDFWDQTHARMREDFTKGLLVDGITNAVLEVGQRLKTHFPYDTGGDINELPNDISVE